MSSERFEAAMRAQYGKTLAVYVNEIVPELERTNTALTYERDNLLDEIEVLTTERDNALLRIEELETEATEWRQLYHDSQIGSWGGVNPNA